MCALQLPATATATREARHSNPSRVMTRNEMIKIPKQPQSINQSKGNPNEKNRPKSLKQAYGNEDVVEKMWWRSMVWRTKITERQKCQLEKWGILYTSDTTARRDRCAGGHGVKHFWVRASEVQFHCRQNTRRTSGWKTKKIRVKNPRRQPLSHPLHDAADRRHATQWGEKKGPRKRESAKTIALVFFSRDISFLPPPHITPRDLFSI